MDGNGIGFPQGSILGPLLFKIVLADLFFIISDVEVASYTDDNAPCTVTDNINDLIKSLKEASTVLF